MRLSVLRHGLHGMLVLPVTPPAAEALARERERFLKFVRARVADPQTALDVLQDALVRALSRLGDLRDEERAVPWFYSILRTTLADLGRRRAREGRADGGDALDAVADTTPAADEERLGANASMACLERLLPLLRPEQAELLRAVDLGDETPEAYAARHGINLGAFRVRRHRARQALRAAILSVCRCLVDVNADCVCPEC
jgi:RNA polymerase sigma-70 factor (ECF subfamily)